MIFVKIRTRFTDSGDGYGGYDADRGRFAYRNRNEQVVLRLRKPTQYKS